MPFILLSTMGRAVMTAEFPAENAARVAAVEWVQTQAETYLSGPLTTRWAKARAWWVGQGGTMEIRPVELEYLDR